MKDGKKKARWRDAPRDQKKAVFTEPSPALQETPCWQLASIDFDGPFGWRGATAQDIEHEICVKLRSFESMTWAEILRASGGKGEGKGNNSHECQIESLCDGAKQRLREIGRDDLDSMFSLRLSGKGRIWGIRRGRVLQVMWWDPGHAVSG